MSKCNDTKLFKLIHAYELGLLDKDQTEQMELHLMNCEKCQNELKAFHKTIQTIKASPKLKHTIEQLDNESSKIVDLRKRWRPSFVYSAVIAAAILAILIFKPWDFEIKSTKEAAAQNNLIAIMDFANITNDADDKNFGHIIPNLLITDISESNLIKAAPLYRIYDMVKLMNIEDTTIINFNLALDLSRNIDAKWMLYGNIVQLNPTLVITVQLVDIDSDEVLMSQRLELGKNETIFSLVDRLTLDIKENMPLPISTSMENDPAIADITTNSIEAYRAYLKGVENYDKLYREEATSWYRKAIEFDSTFAFVYYCLAYDGERDLIHKALKYMYKASKKEQLLIKSLAAEFDGQYEQAIGYLKELVNNYPAEKIAFLELAALYKRHGNIEESIKNYKAVLDIDPLYGFAYNDLAYIYKDLGYRDSAFWAIEKYAEVSNPDEPNLYDSKGDLEAYYGLLPQAIESYEEVYKIKPDFNNYVTILKLGQMYLFKNDYSSANKLFIETAQAPDVNIRVMARTCLALIPLYQGKFNEAISILNDGIAADRMDQKRADTASVVKNLIKAEIYLMLNRYKQTETELHVLKKLIDSTDNKTFVRKYGPTLAYLFAKIGDYETSAEITENLKKNDIKESDDDYWQAKAYVEYAQDNIAPAIEWLNRFNVGNEDKFLNRYFLGRVYLESGEYSKAIDIFEKLQINYYDQQRLVNAVYSVDLNYYLGIAYESFGRVDKAISQFEMFLDIWKNSDQKLDLINDAKIRLAKLKSNS